MASTDYDFIVVGSGIGALTGAIAARLKGLRPLIVEKTPMVGGSSALSGGILWLPNNPLMKRDGVSDSREEALTYLANFTNDDDLISTRARREAFVDNIDAMIETMEAQGMKYARCKSYPDYYSEVPGSKPMGRAVEAPLFNVNELGEWKARFRPPAFSIPLLTSEAKGLLLSGVTMHGKVTAARLASRLAVNKLFGRTVYGTGGSLQGRMLQIVLKMGIDIWTETALSGLDIQNGRVTGVHLTGVRGQETIYTRNGVLIAAGGFARNKGMRERYQRHPVSDSWTKASPGDTGEAIDIMAQAGAGLGMMDQSWWIMSSIPPGEEPQHNVSELAKPHGILVDHAGNRFANEANSYMEIGDACYERNKTTPAIPAWCVMDQRARKKYFWGSQPPGKMPAAWLKSGWVRQADSIEGLAAGCGIDPVGLRATVDCFNGFVRNGRDEDYHRGDTVYNHHFGDPTNRPNPNLGTIEEGPFWAVPLYPGDAGTAGGALIDEHARVLREDGTVIDGLYAAGNCTASLSGPHYVGPGLSIGASSVFGFIAARNASG